MKRIMIPVLAIALVAAPGFLATSFAIQRALHSNFLLRCERDWFGRLRARQVDSPDSDAQLDLPSSCADALEMLLSHDSDGQCLRALPSGSNGVLYFIDPTCEKKLFE
jgi:hypothetical protein